MGIKILENKHQVKRGKPFNKYGTLGMVNGLDKQQIVSIAFYQYHDCDSMMYKFGKLLVRSQNDAIKSPEN